MLPEIMQSKQLGVMEIFQLYGSVVPRCLLHALFSAALGGVLEAMQLDLLSYRVVWKHPYALQLFSMVLGFSLVMRIQIAYARYWEGATNCFLAAAKWVDAAMQMVAFDEASQDAFSEKAFEFRLAIIHYMSLMHAVAMIDMRQDDELGAELALRRCDPFSFRPNHDTQLIAKGLRSLSDSVPDENDDESSKGPRSVPLQGVLHQRKKLEVCAKLHDINSWEALAIERDVELGTKPLNYELSRADRCRNGDGVPKNRVRSRQAPRRQNSATGISMSSALVVLRQTSTAQLQSMIEQSEFDVVGGVSDSEAEHLAKVKPQHRVARVQMWIYRLMTNRLLDGGLDVPAPLLSRTYQVLSDGTAAAMQARKVSHVEFPFALRQLLAILLCTFIVLAPMCIGAFVDSVALTAVLSFAVVLGYVALNETARELEQPFGLDANDLKLVDYQVDFNEKLAELIDQTIPELGYHSTARPDTPPPSLPTAVSVLSSTDVKREAPVRPTGSSAKVQPEPAGDGEPAPQAPKLRDCSAAQGSSTHLPTPEVSISVKP